MNDEYFKNIPSQICVFYSKKRLFWQLTIGLFIGSIGWLTIYTDSKFYIGYFVIFAGIYYVYEAIKKIIEKSPLIILDEKGVETKQFGNFDWNCITSIHVERRRFIRQINDYLVFVADSYSYEINLDELNISFEALEKYIKTYQIRNESKISSN